MNNKMIINNKKEKILLVVLVFILVGAMGSVLGMQTFTYKVGNNKVFMSQATTDKFDIAFRYNEKNFDSCLAGRLNENMSANITLNMKVLDVGCDIYSLYNFIRFIRENNANFSIVLSKKLSSNEISKATSLASLFQISRIVYDSNVSNLASEGNLIVIGNSNMNNITKRIIGNWKYSINDSIIYFASTNTSVKLVLAGTSQEDTIRAIDSLINYTTYFESFTEDCILIRGCENPEDFSKSTPSNSNFKGVIQYVVKWRNGEIGLKEAIKIISSWLKS